MNFLEFTREQDANFVTRYVKAMSIMGVGREKS